VRNGHDSVLPKQTFVKLENKVQRGVVGRKRRTNVAAEAKTTKTPLSSEKSPGKEQKGRNTPQLTAASSRGEAPQARSHRTTNRPNGKGIQSGGFSKRESNRNIVVGGTGGSKGYYQIQTTKSRPQKSASKNCGARSVQSRVEKGWSSTGPATTSSTGRRELKRSKATVKKGWEQGLETAGTRVGTTIPYKGEDTQVYEEETKLGETLKEGHLRD